MIFAPFPGGPEPPMPNRSHEALRLMAILAHPDDETLGTGGSLAKYAAEGVETHVLTATRGQAGRHGGGPHPGAAAVGRMREEELRAAAEELGVAGVHLLDYRDGKLDEADPVEVQERIRDHLMRIRPQVVLTFGPDGAYGHPDHIAISQLATAAVASAGDVVSKLYFMAWNAEAWGLYQEAFKTLASTVDGVERRAVPWPDWAITTRVDARAHWERVWRAVGCHRSQMAIYGALEKLTPGEHQAMWGDQTFYRVFSRVNGGREVETDLFQGLRVASSVPEGMPTHA